MGAYISSSFKPAWWLSSPHCQTLWPFLLRRIDAPPRRHEIYSTPDRDVLELEWCGDRGPLVLILHGLTGSADSHYVKGLQWALHKQGWRSVVLNFRGCGRTPNRTALCYHSGETGDLNLVYRMIRQREPKTPLSVVGYSLGGNVLLKWLGEHGAELDLFAACAVSVPLLLDKCATAMDHGVARIYRNHLLAGLKRYLRAKISYLERLQMWSEVKKLKALGNLESIRSFWEYDDRVIAQLYPFHDVHDYYAKCSSRQFLPHIEIPTLIIQARDDPFTTPEVIPMAEETAPSVLLEITPRGGHVGFVEGPLPGKANYWLERRIPEFLATQFIWQSSDIPGHRSQR
ncbi:MAG: hydrolase [Methylothermaceae bacterium]|nr:hydrolase [Methylothermaceae bacterium]